MYADLVKNADGLRQAQAYEIAVQGFLIGSRKRLAANEKAYSSITAWRL
jgi:hypothetical protein